MTSLQIEIPRIDKHFVPEWRPQNRWTRFLRTGVFQKRLLPDCLLPCGLLPDWSEGLEQHRRLERCTRQDRAIQKKIAWLSEPTEPTTNTNRFVFFSVSLQSSVLTFVLDSLLTSNGSSKSSWSSVFKRCGTRPSKGVNCCFAWRSPFRDMDRLCRRLLPLFDTLT